MPHAPCASRACPTCAGKRRTYGRPQDRSGILSGERMLDLVALGDDLGHLRFAVDGSRDRFLGGAIIVVLDLLVVGGFPMDEHADANEEVVGFVLGNDTFRDAVGHSLRHRVLSGAEHLHGLLRSLIVTLLNRIVGGLQSKFGAMTARSEVKPSLLFVKAWVNADSTALPRGPIMRSMWATSFPSPTSDSPTQTPLIFAIAISSQGKKNLRPNPDILGIRLNGYPCCQRPARMGRTG